MLKLVAELGYVINAGACDEVDEIGRLSAWLIRVLAACGYDESKIVEIFNNGWLSETKIWDILNFEYPFVMLSIACEGLYYDDRLKVESCLARFAHWLSARTKGWGKVQPLESLISEFIKYYESHD